MCNFSGLTIGSCKGFTWQAWWGKAMLPASDLLHGELQSKFFAPCILILAFLAQVPSFLGLFIWGMGQRTFSEVFLLGVVRKKGKSEGTFLYSWPRTFPHQALLCHTLPDLIVHEMARPVWRPFFFFNFFIVLC